MGAITQLDRAEMAALLQRYELGELLRYRPASEGIENSNYFVELRRDGGTASHVVTIIEPPATADPGLVALLDRLDEAGLPVPAIRRNRCGEAYDSVRGKPVLVASRLPGSHVERPTAHHCAAVGRLLARLHGAARPLSARATPHARDSSWLRAQLAQVEGRIPFTDLVLMRHCVRISMKLLARKDVRALPRGIIHGDLFRDNVLFAGDALAGVLDFHHSGLGYLLYDIAVAANDWCTHEDGALDPHRVLTLLRGYHAIRPLATHELWFFAPFTLYAALTFWLSRATRAVAAARGNEGLSEQPPAKDPAELQRIVQERLARPFTPDPWLTER